MSKLKNMNWMSILGLLLIVFGTIFSFFGTFFSDEKGHSELTQKIQEKNNTIDEIKETNNKLIDQNTSLVNSNNEVSTTNKDLINQNTEMLIKVGKYQTDIEIRNKKIELLEKEVHNVKEYSNYAKMDMYGLIISGSSVSSELSTKMNKILKKDGNNVSVIIDKNNLILVDEIIEQFPNFPFGYFAKEQILKHLGDEGYKTYAEKAIKILEVTTSISGHHLVHDRVLNILKSD